MPNLRLRAFKDRHLDGRCVIVCNGPSLNNMELGFLRNETVIGLNKIHLGLDRFGFQPDYLVAVNAKVVEQANEAMAMLPAIRFIGARAAKFLPETDRTFHVPVLNAPVMFSEDICTGVREGGTVTHAALQIAYFMGFKEVVIIGMDHRFTYEGAPHETRFMDGPDTNHFSSDYFRGNYWDNPDLDRSEASYRVARERYEAAGRRIFDATLNGACTVFEKVNYKAYFA